MLRADGDAAEASQRVKHAKYDELCAAAGYAFLGVAFDALGAPSKDTLELFSMIGRAWGRRVNLGPSRAIPMVAGAVITTLLRAIGQLLVRNSAPTAAPRDYVNMADVGPTGHFAAALGRLPANRSAPVFGDGAASSGSLPAGGPATAAAVDDALGGESGIVFEPRWNDAGGAAEPRSSDDDGDDDDSEGGTPPPALWEPLATIPRGRRPFREPAVPPPPGDRAGCQRVEREVRGAPPRETLGPAVTVDRAFPGVVGRGLTAATMAPAAVRAWDTPTTVTPAAAHPASPAPARPRAAPTSAGAEADNAAGRYFGGAMRAGGHERPWSGGGGVLNFQLAQLARDVAQATPLADSEHARQQPGRNVPVAASTSEEAAPADATASVRGAARAAPSDPRASGSREAVAPRSAAGAAAAAPRSPRCPPSGEQAVAAVSVSASVPQGESVAVITVQSSQRTQQPAVQPYQAAPQGAQPPRRSPAPTASPAL